MRTISSKRLSAEPTLIVRAGPPWEEAFETGSFVFFKLVVEGEDLRTRSDLENGKTVFEIQSIEEGDVDSSGRSLRCRC